MSKQRLPRPRVALRKASNGRWYFYKVNANGRKTEVSQTYAHKGSAKFAAKRDIPGLPIFEEAA